MDVKRTKIKQKSTFERIVGVVKITKEEEKGIAGVMKITKEEEKGGALHTL